MKKRYSYDKDGNIFDEGCCMTVRGIVGELNSHAGMKTREEVEKMRDEAETECYTTRVHGESVLSKVWNERIVMANEILNRSE